MKTLDDVKTYLIEPAIKRECKVLLSDFDVPLLTSINRMFKRDPRGKDPLQSLGPIKEGFKEIRSHRIEIIDYIKNEKIIEQYNLYYLGRLVALKLNDKFEILDKENYNKCFEIPSDHEIEEALNRVIDEEYIKEAVMRGDLQLEDTAVLEKWKSLTIRCALEAHAGRI